MQINNRQKLVFPLLLVFVFIVSALIIPWIYPIEKMEGGTYGAYTESLLKDGDFNIMNQMPKHIAWYASPTLNYPDISSTGTAVLWAPFYSYGYALEKIVTENSFSGYRAEDISQLLLSVFMTILLLILTQRTLKLYYPDQNNTFIVLNLFLGTGLFFYFFAIPTNNDITTAAMVALLFLFTLNILQNKQHPIVWLFLGLFAGFLVTVKTVSGYYFLILVLGALCFSQEGTLKDRLKRLGFLGIGFGFLFFFWLANSSLQRGSLAEPRLVASGAYIGSVLPDLLFGSRSYFLISPVYLIALFYPLYVSIQWIRNRQFQFNKTAFILSVAICVKVVLFSIRFFSNEYFGARILILDFILISFIFGEIFRLCKKKWLTVLFSVFCAWTLLQSLVKIAVDQYIHELSPSHWKSVIAFYQSAANLATHTCFSKDYWHIIYYLPLILILVLILTKVKTISILSRETEKNFVILSFIFFGITVISSGLNFYFLPKNTAELYTQGFYNDIAIVKGPLSLGYEGFVSEINLEMLLAKRKNDQEKIQKLKAMKENYIAQIQPEILYDPLKRFSKPADEATSFFDYTSPEDTSTFQYRQSQIFNRCSKE